MKRRIKVNRMSEKDIKDVKVADVYEISIGKPAIVGEEAILKDAMEAMTLNMVSRKVYVVDGEGILKGVITIEALLRQLGYRVGVRKAGMISFFRFLSGIFKESVIEFMETPVAITDEHELLDALRMMVEHHLNDLPVVDEQGRLLGELNSLEILKHSKKIFDE
jgi:CBS domain-containing protein